MYLLIYHLCLMMVTVSLREWTEIEGKEDGPADKIYSQLTAGFHVEVCHMI